MPDTVTLRAILSDLQQLAQFAYWKDRTDCGADWNRNSDCVNCQHNAACGLSVSITRGISNLAHQAGG